LVLFESKHCGSSVSFRPTWDALKSTLQTGWNADGLVVLEADGWANDWPEWLNIVGLPDVRLFPGDDPQSWFRFGGQRKVDALLAWLQDNCYNALSKRSDRIDTDKMEL